LIDDEQIVPAGIDDDHIAAFHQLGPRRLIRTRSKSGSMDL
jgi:hypothetical protein